MTKKPIRFVWSAGVGQDAGPKVQGQSWFSVDAYASPLQMMEHAGVEFAVLTETIRPTLNPMVLASALSATTNTIGIVPELVTIDYPPFKLARLIGTLTHVTRGRIGWAMDTSLTQPGAHNYGFDQVPPAELRHEIASEYVEACQKLWASWSPGAIVEDVEKGIFADPSKVRAIEHVGTYFRVRGPLNIMTEPYGTPLLVQTIMTDGEYRFAARYADVAIISGRDAEELAGQREQLRTYAAESGRDPEAIKTYFSVALQIGETSGAVDAWPKHKQGGLNVAGSVEEVASDLQEVFDASLCDGIVIQGTWNPVQVNVICNQLIALIRRKGRMIPFEKSTQSLREDILTADQLIGI